MSSQSDRGAAAQKRSPERAKQSVAGKQSHARLLRSYNNLQTEFQRRMVGLASAAHELKTPLTILSGYTDLLITEKVGPITPKQRRVLKEMQYTRVRLEHFIEDFLNYGAMVTGNLTLRIQPNDICACVEEIVDLWQPRFREKLIAFYHLDMPSVELFPFDYYKVQHVISNLLQNALKFTPEKGTVWVSVEPYYWERRAAQKKVSNERRTQRHHLPNSVRIIVSDTGPGIRPEYHLEIFEDFARAELNKNHGDGIGLGLAVSRNLMHAHGGKIWVESTPGAGSKFCFLLPFKQERGEGSN